MVFGKKSKLYKRVKLALPGAKMRRIKREVDVITHCFIMAFGLGICQCLFGRVILKKSLNFMERS